MGMARSSRLSVLAMLAFGVVAYLASQGPSFVPAPGGKHMRAGAVAAPAAVAMLSATPAFADEIGDAAKKLSEASYPFLKDIDWKSTLALTKPGSAGAGNWLKAIDKAIVMGASMDSKLLKAAVEAHHKAIGSAGSSGLTSKADYEAINAALGRAIASVPESQVMDVYNSFSSLERRCAELLDVHSEGGGCESGVLCPHGFQGCGEGSSNHSVNASFECF